MDAPSGFIPENATTLDQVDMDPSVRQLLERWVQGHWWISPPGQEVAIEANGIRVELEDIGEGFSGDYDEEDPNDRPLLRFTFLARPDPNEDPIALSETSWCTEIDAECPWEVQLACAGAIFEGVYDGLEFGPDDEVDEAWGRRAQGACENMAATSDKNDCFAALVATLAAASRSASLDQALPAPRSSPSTGSRM